MYLSKLTLHGFKSFADPTELHFDPGVTAIVGPNGCGKSNIVDAVRWVIGEQRPSVLRSDKMENVIFNGTTERRPLGMAEVELTIQNNRGVLPTEYSEVTIGRRLFRDGKSEYLMNGTQCRLKDITSLFMDTGMGADAYSVIELKMVDEIVSESAEDRRRLFEEAAGITRYKKRRRQALRKLDNTQTDLDRIRDLTDEISTQVERLEKQAEKAQKYEEYTDRLHELELKLAQVEYSRLTAKQESLQRELDELEAAIEEKTSQQNEAEDRLEALRETLATRESELEEAREALQEHRTEVNRLEAEQRLQRERLNQARRDRDRIQKERKEAQTRQRELTRRETLLKAALAQSRPSLEVAQRRLDEATNARDAARAAANEQRAAVQPLREQEEELEETLAERRRTLDRLTNRLEMLQEERARTQQQLDNLGTDDLDRRVAQTDAERQAAQSELEEAREALADVESIRDKRQADLDAAQDELRDLERRRDALQAEADLLKSLVSSYEDASDAVRFLAESPPDGLDELRTVADVLACDDDLRIALDAALGDLAACIVVPDEQTARQTIRRLRDEEQGQATFIVLDRLPPLNAPPPPEAAEPLLAHIRTTDPAYDPLATALLRDVLLVDTLEDAQSLVDTVSPSTRIVTRTGEWIDGRGLLRGGSQLSSPSPMGNRLGRREQLKRVQTDLEELDQSIEEQKRTVDRHQAALNELNVDDHRTAVEDAEAALSEAEQAYERAQYEREQMDERQTELRERLDELAREIETVEQKIDTLQSKVDDATEKREALRTERAEAEAALEEAEAHERELVDAHSSAQVAAVEAQNRLDTLERDLERVRQRSASTEKRLQTQAEKLEELDATIDEALDEQSELDAQIEAIRAERSTRDEAVSEAEERLHETRQSIAEVESNLRRLRRERDQLLQTENERSVDQAEVETRIEDLVESIREDFDVDLTDAAIDVEGSFDEDEARSKVKSLRAKVNGLGNVNPLALDEYEEEKERLDFLMDQKADLEEAEETLLETIEEINTTAAEQFDETFTSIRENFGDIFSELFGGEASAKLKLDDPDDPLESDINIVAKPRGKRPSTLAQLSSGEKALTATALLFAIYLVKPSPFCILDEVDAPLDEANVERFMNLVRRFEDDTQFILVTHDQRTMALADRMYGITMEERGVSKLVGVEFDEAVTMAE